MYMNNAFGARRRPSDGNGRNLQLDDGAVISFVGEESPLRRAGGNVYLDEFRMVQ